MSTFAAPSRNDRRGAPKRRYKSIADALQIDSIWGRIGATCTRRAYDHIHTELCPLCIEQRRRDDDALRTRAVFVAIVHGAAR